jgi:hypothetical protein
MKLENLNLGKALSKDEQKKITGGSGTCNTGQKIRCICTGYGYPVTICYAATYDNEPETTMCTTICSTYGTGGTDGPAAGTYCGDPLCVPN